jgi:hypothetical protein
MIKLFNLDLHISVIEDLKHIIHELYGDKISITDWSISNMSWVFNKPISHVDIINQHTWKNIDDELINKFFYRYYDFLSGFDGFIVTHTPVFCLLYEKFNKPIILINSCRYEQPFSWTNDIYKWNNLNIKLKNMWENKQLTVVSNNKADKEYLKLGTGIVSILIPSLCLYTKVKYNPKNDICVIYNNNNINIPENNKLKHKTSVLKNNYSWEELYNFKGIIHMPYEVSTMSLFEQYSANIPLFFPTKNFLKNLIIHRNYYFQSRYNKIHNLNNNCHPNLINALDDKYWVDFWIDNADYYDGNNMKHIIYFNNFEELNFLINTSDFNKISNDMKQHNTERVNDTLEKWKNIVEKIFTTI